MASTRNVRARRASAAAPAAIEVTPEKVEQLFRKAWPKAARYPDLSACYGVAVAINVVRHSQSSPKVAEPKIATALKHARLLLRHLPTLRETWQDEQYNCEQLAAVFPRLKGNLENCATVLDNIEQIERCVRALTEASQAVRPAQPNPATFVASKVQLAWCGVHAAPATKSGKPDAPLCAFIRDALASAGKHFALDTVSDMLRERHRRERPARAKKTIR